MEPVALDFMVLFLDGAINLQYNWVCKKLFYNLNLLLK
jgi:hypothetical protein